MARPRNGPPGDDFTKEQFFFWRHDPGVGPLSATLDPNNALSTGWKLQFEAHIVSVSDSFSPGWTDNYDMGRADPKVFYSNTSRTIAVQFFVVAMNEKEHINNNDNLEKLALCTQPIYKNGLGYNAPHVMYNIGFLHGGYGIIKSLDYSWNYGDTPLISRNPIITDVNITIQCLADINGKRPSVRARIWK